MTRAESSAWSERRPGSCRRSAATLAADTGSAWTTRNLSGALRSARRARDSYLVASTNRLPLDASDSSVSAMTSERPGKLSNNRNSSASSSMNVAGPPVLARAPVK